MESLAGGADYRARAVKRARHNNDVLFDFFLRNNNVLFDFGSDDG